MRGLARTGTKPTDRVPGCKLPGAPRGAALALLPDRQMPRGRVIGSVNAVNFPALRSLAATAHRRIGAARRLVVGSGQKIRYL